MSLEASKVTGIAVQHGKVYLHGQEMPTCTLQKCLEDFNEWLSTCENPVILIAHNAMFDATIFINACLNTNQYDTTSAKVAGFLDTLQVLKHYYPGKRNYKQSTLVLDILQTSYTAHDALEDCKSLCQLYEHTKKVNSMSTDRLLEFTFPCQYVKEKVIHDKQTKCNKNSLQHMIDNSVISKMMAGKIAGSGLSLRSLQFAYKREVQNGVKTLFQEKVGSKCRVTNC